MWKFVQCHVPFKLTRLTLIPVCLSRLCRTHALPNHCIIPPTPPHPPTPPTLHLTCSGVAVESGSPRNFCMYMVVKASTIFLNSFLPQSVAST